MMNKRIKKKQFKYAVINAICYYAEMQHNKEYNLILIEDEIFDEKYGFIFIDESEIKRAISLLRKNGHIVNYNKFIPRGLGRTGWIFNFINRI